MTTADQVAIAGLVVGVITLGAALFSVYYGARAARTADRQLALQLQSDAEQQERERVRLLVAPRAHLYAGITRFAPGGVRLVIRNVGAGRAAIVRLLVDGEPAKASRRVACTLPVDPIAPQGELAIPVVGGVDDDHGIRIAIDWLDEGGSGHWEGQITG